jgi:preprotein translocase subunit SecE
VTEEIRGSVATTERAPAKPVPAGGGTGRRRDGGGRGPVGRSGLFYRQVIAELRKVIWPTRNELLTYTTVAVVFITIMVTIVSLLDLGFAKAVLEIFG